MAEYLYPTYGTNRYKIFIINAYLLAPLVSRETVTLRRKKKLSQNRAVIVMTTEVKMMTNTLESIIAI
jgi:hypothetical protein